MTAWQAPLDFDVPLHRLTLRLELLDGSRCGPIELEAVVREAELCLEARCLRCGDAGGGTWSPAAEHPGSFFGADSHPAALERPELRGWGRALPSELGECASDRRWASDALEPAHAMLREAVALTEAATCPRSADVARLQHPSVAPAVYHAVRRDPSGRVHQLARVRPVLLALWLDAALPLDPILEGVKTRDLVHRLAARRGLDTDEERALAWWVRELAPWADTRDLYRVARHRVPESDAPDDPDARLHWYRSVACVTHHVGDREPTRGSLAAARYVSRHWEARVLQRETFLDRIGPYAEATGHLPDRRTNPRKLFHDVSHWWFIVRDIEVWRREVERLETEGGGDLPEPPWPDHVEGDVSIRAIRRARALLEEALAMEHCVYTYLDSVQDGIMAIYSVTVGGARSTLALEQGISGIASWVIIEHNGPCNRPPSARARREAAGWAGRCRRSAPPAEPSFHCPRIARALEGARAALDQLPPPLSPESPAGAPPAPAPPATPAPAPGPADPSPPATT